MIIVKDAMPAEDKIHNAVRSALIKDGWTITNEPFTLEYGSDRFYADICAQREEEAARRVIVVEVKSFVGASPMREFELALGQYEIYRDLLEMNALDYDLYLAIDTDAYTKLTLRPTFAMICTRHRVALLIVEAKTEEIVQWINAIPTRP